MALVGLLVIVGSLMVLAPSVTAEAPAIIGSVASSDGKPIEKVPVTVFEARTQWQRGEFLGGIETSADGTFRFGIGAGCYIIVAKAPDGYSFESPSAADRYDQIYGCVTDVDTFDYLGVLYREGAAAAFAGQVVFDGGEAVADVRTNLFVAETPWKRGRFLGSRSTDPGGVYSFPVDPGCYIVVVIAPDNTSFDSANAADRYDQRHACVKAGDKEPRLRSVLYRVDPTDAEPPTAPPQFTVRGDLTNATFGIVQWTAATDNVGVTGYRLYQDGIQVAELPADPLDYTFRDLTPETTYTFGASAIDAAGNESPLTTGTATTRALPTAGNEAINLYWKENGQQATTMEVPFNIRQIAPASNMFFSQPFSFADSGGYFGLQQKEGERLALISFWSRTEDSSVGQVAEYRGPVADDCRQPPDEPGIFGPFSCFVDFDWQENETYVLRWERRTGAPDEEAVGAWWNMSIRTSGGVVALELGDFLVRRPAGQDHAVVDTSTFLEEFTVDAFCQTPPLVVLEVGRPQFNGGAGSAEHDLTVPGDCSAGASAESDFFPGGGRTLSMGE